MRDVFLRPIAHRGLHDKARGIIENTGPAFLAAIDRGYGIECDLRAAAGGTPMVFHDATLDRLVEASGPIAFRSPARLARLRYMADARAPILTFAEFLALVAGRVPLLVEVKSSRRPGTHFLDKIANEASGYRGPLALMSFERRTVSALLERAPALPCGWILGTHHWPARWWAAARKGGRSTAVATLLKRAPRGISFLAVDVKMLPEAAAWRAREAKELALFTWTIRTPGERATAARFADAPIFEGYEP